MDWSEGNRDSSSCAIRGASVPEPKTGGRTRNLGVLAHWQAEVTKKKQEALVVLIVLGIALISLAVSRLCLYAGDGPSLI